MKKTQQNAQLSALNKAKTKRIGLFEKSLLKIAGYKDGKRNLPCEGPLGWMSPHIDIEIRSYDEFAGRVWGRLQVENAESYTHLSELMDSIVNTKSLIDKARSELNEAREKEILTNNLRKKGEEHLNDEQIKVRRSNELEKKLAPLKENITTLQNKLKSDVDELSHLHGAIVENENSYRMVCYRVKSHIYRRLDIYWQGSMRKHRDKARMPAVPSVEITSRSEEAYMEPHKELMRRAELLSAELSKAEEDKEVN